MRRFTKWITWITRTEGVVAFGDYVWVFVRQVLGLSGAAIMAWLSSHLGWFWDTFSWAGVFGVGILTWFIVVSGLYLTTARALRRNVGVLSLDLPAANPDASLPKHQGGDTFSAAGTVRDPPLLDPKCLYVGNMNVSISRLAEKRVIDISIRAFNGSNNSIFIQRVEGKLRLSEAQDGQSRPHGDLPPPWLVEGDGKPKVEQIKHGEEFTISLEQRVSQEIAEKIEQIGGSYRLHLACDELNIVMASHFGKQSVRLPLWDGISLSRGSDVISAGRIHALKANNLTIGVNQP